MPHGRSNSPIFAYRSKSLASYAKPQGPDYQIGLRSFCMQLVPVSTRGHKGVAAASTPRVEFEWPSSSGLLFHYYALCILFFIFYFSIFQCFCGRFSAE